MAAYTLVVKLSSHLGQQRAGWSPQSAESHLRPTGAYPYEPACVVLAAEALKVVLSAFLLWWTYEASSAQRVKSYADSHNWAIQAGKGDGDDEEESGDEETAAALTVDMHSTLLYGAPALLYFVNNNVAFWCMHYLDPGAYSVLVQLKIATTVVAFRVAFGATRPIGTRRWAALALLLAGCVTSQLRESLGETLAQPVVGLALVVLQCTISAVASVATEWLLKRSRQSIHLQNVQLYSFGMLFGNVALAAKGLTPLDLVRGWNAATYASLLLLSFTGLAVSFVMKWADNLIKVFATAGSMFLTTAAASVLFGSPVRPQQWVGAVVASVALYLYATNPPQSERVVRPAPLRIVTTSRSQPCSSARDTEKIP